MSSDAGFESAASRTVDLFSEGLSKWGIELSASERSSFSSYAEMLVDWNKNRFNLTRLTSPEQIALNHFLDSVVLTQIVKVPVKSIVIDVGTGAGFPGLPFKILRPDIKLVLIESTAKKLSFCKAVSESASLANVEFIYGRAEDDQNMRRFGRTANIVTARAVAPLRTLLEWTAPYVTAGGSIVAWKGPKVHQEVADARATADRFKLKMEIIERTLSIGGESLSHYYVVCRTR